jgi:hypothetical protein
VEKFFLQHVPHHKDDVEYWVVEIFRSCRKHNAIFTPFSQMVMILSKRRSYWCIPRLSETPSFSRRMPSVMRLNIPTCWKLDSNVSQERHSMVACLHKRILFCLLALVHATGYEPS